MKPIKPLFLVVLLSLVVMACDDVIEDDSAGSISGIVIDYVTMEPVSGAVVVTNPPSNSVMTNEEGSFVFDDMEQGDYMVSAQKYLYAKTSVNVCVTPNTISGVIIQLEEDSSSSAVQFTDVLPEDQSEDVEVGVTLCWAAYTEGLSGVEYNLKVYDTNSAKPFIDVSSLTDTFYVAEDLEYSTTHFWQVTAYKNDRQVGQSTLWTFRTVGASGSSYNYANYYQLIPVDISEDLLGQILINKKDNVKRINVGDVNDRFFIGCEKCDLTTEICGHK